MWDVRRYAGRLALASLLLGGLSLVLPSEARARCRAKNIKKIKKYTKKALEDYQMLEVKSALKRITRAIDHAEDNDCDTKVEYARALMVRGIIHLAGQQDKTRGKLYMTKAIKANPCVKLESGQPPNVAKVWKKLRRKLRKYKCKTGGEPTPPDVEPPPPRDEGKPCEHTTLEEATAGSPIQMKVNVSPTIGAGRVIVYYRPHGKALFSKLLLSKPSAGRTWTGAIPAKEVRGSRLAYYIEVRNGSGSVICKPTSATAGAPEIIMLKGDPCMNLPPDFCESNKGHKCCTRPGPGPGPGPRPGPKGYWPRFYLNIGFSMGAGLLSTGMTSDLEKKSPYEAGFALGPIGATLEFGYFLGRSHLLSAAGRFGMVFSDVSDTAVITYQGFLRYRFYALGGGRRDLFSLYLGAQVGGGVLYHSLLVPTDEDGNKKDTFMHGYVMVGAVLGVQIGSQKVGWFVEVDPGGVFPNQSTFVLGISTGVALRF